MAELLCYVVCSRVLWTSGSVSDESTFQLTKWFTIRSSTTRGLVICQMVIRCFDIRSCNGFEFSGRYILDSSS